MTPAMEQFGGREPAGQLAGEQASLREGFTCRQLRLLRDLVTLGCRSAILARTRDGYQVRRGDQPGRRHRRETVEALAAAGFLVMTAQGLQMREDLAATIEMLQLAPRT